MSNKISRVVSKINKMPVFLQPTLLTLLFASMVKYARTTGIKIQKITNNEVEITLANKRKVQNHIGGIHAVAAALLAESATGIVFGMNVPDTSIPVLKSLTLKFQRRMKGALKANAEISDEQIAQIQQHEKGDMLIKVIITDESDQSPIECEMDWAWISKKR